MNPIRDIRWDRRVDLPGVTTRLTVILHPPEGSRDPVYWAMEYDEHTLNGQIRRGVHAQTYTTNAPGYGRLEIHVEHISRMVTVRYLEGPFAGRYYSTPEALRDPFHQNYERRANPYQVEIPRGYEFINFEDLIRDDRARGRRAQPPESRLIAEYKARPKVKRNLPKWF
jgi:hypothetical protein